MGGWFSSDSKAEETKFFNKDKFIVEISFKN